MKKSAIAIALLILIGTFAISYLYYSKSPANTISYSKFFVNNKTFAITYLATNQSTWESGLMNKTITNSTTMLFAFPGPGVYPFWMLNTLTSLDMIWVNGSASSGTVVYIAKNTTSCFDISKCQIYNPNRLANYVIEAKAGFAIKNQIGVGSLIRFN